MDWDRVFLDYIYLRLFTHESQTCEIIFCFVFRSGMHVRSIIDKDSVVLKVNEIRLKNSYQHIYSK